MAARRARDRPLGCGPGPTAFGRGARRPDHHHPAGRRPRPPRSAAALARCRRAPARRPTLHRLRRGPHAGEGTRRPPRCRRRAGGPVAIARLDRPRRGADARGTRGASRRARPRWPGRVPRACRTSRGGDRGGGRAGAALTQRGVRLLGPRCPRPRRAGRRLRCRWTPRVARRRRGSPRPRRRSRGPGPRGRRPPRRPRPPGTTRGRWPGRRRGIRPAPIGQPDPRGISFRRHDPARTMIYFCLPVRNEAATVGLVLWKIRQVLQDTPREYQLLVGDDASDDATREVLQGYEASLPLTVLRSDSPIGYAATVERLLRTALERSDRHKRDAAILWPTDYTVDPASVEEFIKKFESGADLIVGEAHLEGEPDRGQRLIRRWAPTLLGRRVRVPGVHDVVSGVAAFRLVALRQAFRDRGE